MSEPATVRRTTSMLDPVRTQTLVQPTRPRKTSVFVPVPTHPDSIEQQEADARRSIAQWLVLAYIGLLAFGVVASVVLLWVPKNSQSFTVADVKDVMGSINGVLTGFVGVLGFVMGYYFKSFDSAPSAHRDPRRVAIPPRKRPK